MTQHSTAFDIERSVPAADALQDLPPASRAPATAKNFNFRKLLMAGAAVAALAGAGWYGFDYWTVGRYLVSTDDAYVMAGSTTVAPNVAGDQARADVAAAQAEIASKQAQLGVQQAVIDAAKPTIDVDNATVTFAAQENKRYTDLAATGFGSVQNAQQAQSRNAGAQAAIARDAANLASALKQVDLLKAEIVQANAAMARAEAVQSQAELNLEYTSIVAPINGVVGNRSLRIGQFEVNSRLSSAWL